MNSIEYASENYTSRWLGYFDLMGTRKLIGYGKIDEVFKAYQEALNHLKDWKHDSIYHAWFSDTFIIFSEDDSISSFLEIEKLCRYFIFSLIYRNIPVRGALSCGNFYADRKNSLYLGAALVDAYEWGENQDWIGFILCPSSGERLANLDYSIEKHPNYVKYEVLFKKPEKSKITVPRTVKVDACKFDMILWNGGLNLLLPKLEKMAKSQKDPGILLKYARTIEFLTKNERKRIIK